MTSPSETGALSGSRDCPHCEASVPPGALFCHLCGGEVEPQPPADPHARLRERLARALGDRYRILDVLGVGGMGIVFLAENVERGRRVAIKVLSPELAADANLVARFAREARTVSALEHPSIVRVYEHGNDRGLHYFIMQYVAGRSLAEVLHDEPRASIPFTIRVLREAAAALATAHRHGVVHRDVKPENMMIDESGRVLLTDFGISRLSQGTDGATTMVRLTETGGIIGTPHYMAPEHALGQAVDGRADQYSLAVVGFQMLAGRLPFEDDTAPAIIHLHINTAAPRLSSLRKDVPPHLAATIARAMSKSPAHRYQTMDEFASALADSSHAPASFGRRIAVTLALLAAAGAAGAWWIRRDDAGGQTPRSAASVATKPQTLRLTVTSSPSATLYIDGRRVGVTPVSGYQLNGARQHTVRLERKGYRTRRDTLDALGTRTVRRNYVMQRQAK